MGFNKVYKSLQDVFPQVDSRVLRAVAIEHSKDVDAAVDVVLAEVIPFLEEKRRFPSPSDASSTIEPPEVDAKSMGQMDGSLMSTGASGKEPIVYDANSGDLEEDQKGKQIYDADTEYSHERKIGSSACEDTDGSLMSSRASDKSQNGSSICDATAGDLDEDRKSEQIYDTNTRGSHGGKIGSSTCGDTGLSDKEQNDSSSYDANSGGLDEEQNDCQVYDTDTRVISDEQNGSLTRDTNVGDSNSAPHAGVRHHELLAEGTCGHAQVNGEYVSGETVLSGDRVQENTIGESDETADCNNSNLEVLDTLLSHTVVVLRSGPGVTDDSFVLDDAREVIRDGNEENVYVSLGQGTSLTAQDITFTPEGSDELVVIPEMINSVLGESHCSMESASTTEMVKVNIEDDSTLDTSMDLLDDMIEDAKRYTGILTSAHESLFSLMSEVEIQERAAEEAEEAAGTVDLDLLREVDDRTEMIQRAKETNQRHAAEVYGEAAILVTEVKELQSRVISVSLLRDKSLEILDERHQALASRLAAAEEKIKVLEKEKREKEDAARKKLAELELSMEEVVQEANMIKQAAEKNAKVQAFVDERGRVVDILQGEISLIYQDLTSSQTTSSSASSKSLTTPDQEDQVPHQYYASPENQKHTDTIPHSSEMLPSREPIDEDVHKALRDEGWEIFENGDYI